MDKLRITYPAGLHWPHSHLQMPYGWMEEVNNGLSCEQLGSYWCMNQVLVLGFTLWLGQQKKTTAKSSPSHYGELKCRMKSGKGQEAWGHSVPCTSPQCHVPSGESEGRSAGPVPTHRGKQWSSKSDPAGYIERLDTMGTYAGKMPNKWAWTSLMPILRRHARSVFFVLLNARDNCHGILDREQELQHEVAGRPDPCHCIKTADVHWHALILPLVCCKKTTEKGHTGT